MSKVLIFLFILPLAYSCVAQSLRQNEFHFNHLSIKNGLPEDVITATLQDKEGYMWIGTQGGLVRYDGYTTRVYQFGIEDPLNAGVNCIYEDRSGKLWVGTMNVGLYRYDRAKDEFVHYMHNATDVNSLGAGVIISMHDDPDGNLWILLADNFDFVARHVNMLNSKKNQFKHFGILEKGNRFINADQFNSLFEDSTGHIWTGSSNGIYEYDATSDHFIPHLASADSSQQKSFGWLTEDSSHPGLIWMTVWGTKSGKGEGLIRYDPAGNIVKTYRHAAQDLTSLGNDTVTAIQKDSKGHLWIGTLSGLSVFEFSSERFTNYGLPDKKPGVWDNAIWNLKADNAGKIWFIAGSNLFGQNLLFFDTKAKSFTRYTSNEKDPDAPPTNGISNLLIDRSGILWIGTMPRGIYWLNSHRSKFMVYKSDPVQPHYFPGGGSTSFAEGKDGTFWLWSSHGLYHWYPSSDSFVFIKKVRDQGNDNIWHVSSTIMDKKGVVWCNTYGNGIFTYDPASGKMQNFRNRPGDSTSLSFDYVNTLFEDTKGMIWVGTHGGGLCSFNRETGKFKRYPWTWFTEKGPADNHILNDQTVYCICEDKQGVLWLGTNLSGLNRFNPETGIFTSYKNQSPGATISSIFEDSKEQLWIGTHASGLFLFDQKANTFKKFSENNGLLYDGILGISEDNENNLWITSQRGISLLNIQSQKISRPETSNELPEEPDLGNLFRTSSGYFLMPFKNGFISFDPRDLKPETAVPVIHIECVEINRPPAPGKNQVDSIIGRYANNKINLRHDENRITFNYVGLQYQNSALNQYAYRLDGYDKEWIQAGTQRKATYANLSPGSYTFHVKAANSDGVWSTEDDFITIVISPPWWITWWAFSLYVIIAGSIIYALYRNRINQLKNKQAAQINVMVAAQEGERKRISRDLHDDVGTKLSALKLFLSFLHEKASKINNEEIRTLAENSEQFITEVMQDVRQLLMNLSPTVLEEFGYTVAVEGLVNKINETKQIHFNLVIFGMSQQLRKDYELALYRITQELINNVLKHAEAKNVALQIGQRDEKIIFMIEDDGKGFNINLYKEGYGLDNLEARTKLMNGTMIIDSKVGKGTSVLIEIPYNFNAA